MYLLHRTLQLRYKQFRQCSNSHTQASPSSSSTGRSWSSGDNGPDTWTAAITCVARIVDVRPIVARGEEPFDTIMAAAGALDPGQPLVVLVPFEPVPLEGVLSAQGFTWSAETLDTGDWRVVFQAAA